MAVEAQSSKISIKCKCTFCVKIETFYLYILYRDKTFQLKTCWNNFTTTLLCVFLLHNFFIFCAMLRGHMCVEHEPSALLLCVHCTTYSATTTWTPSEFLLWINHQTGFVESPMIYKNILKEFNLVPSWFSEFFNYIFRIQPNIKTDI